MPYILPEIQLDILLQPGISGNKTTYNIEEHTKAGGSCTFSHFESQWEIGINFHEIPYVKATTGGLWS